MLPEQKHQNSFKKKLADSEEQQTSVLVSLQEINKLTSELASLLEELVNELKKELAEKNK